jgi:hypothetical protein
LGETGFVQSRPDRAPCKHRYDCERAAQNHRPNAISGIHEFTP